MTPRLRWTLSLATLTLTAVLGAPRRTDADVEKHQALIGKKAPEIDPDFVANGKPVTLKQLNGEVVLVVFGGIWSNTTRGVLETLRSLHKQYYRKGLVVILATRYDSEMGRRVELDKEGAPSVTAIKPQPPNLEREHALLKEYGRIHELEFRLMRLGGEQARKTVKDYGVSGIPQFVVIDRKGVVRLIRVGRGTDTLDPVRAMIDKLVDE